MFWHTWNKFKNYSPQSHRGHREKPCSVIYATGAVNKVKLCALWGEMLLSTDRRVRRAHRNWPTNLTARCARRTLQPWLRYHNYVMAFISASALSGLIGCKWLYCQIKFRHLQFIGQWCDEHIVYTVFLCILSAFALFALSGMYMVDGFRLVIKPHYPHRRW